VWVEDLRFVFPVPYIGMVIHRTTIALLREADVIAPMTTALT